MNDQSKKKQSMSSKSDKLCLTLKQCGPQFFELRDFLGTGFKDFGDFGVPLCLI